VTFSLGWVTLALVALGAEAIVANLVFLFVSVAALLAADIAALGGSVPIQIAAFAFTAALLPALLRPRLLEKLSGRGVLSRTEALMGATAHVTEQIDPVRGTGRVVVNGQDWAARSSSTVPFGATVQIEGADGIVLLVTPLAAPTASLPPT
jgi:membrane protein implicated in regulation of membrane protease activity